MIRLRTLLAETVVLNQVTIAPANPRGGGLEVRYKDEVNLYRVTADSVVYTGPIAVTGLWPSKRHQDIYILQDNTGKQFELPHRDMHAVTMQLRNMPAKIQVKTHGVTITLTRT